MKRLVILVALLAALHTSPANAQVGTYAAKVLSIESASLLAYYPMDELSGTTVIIDESLNGLDAVPSGAALAAITGPADGRPAPYFDGINDRIAPPVGFNANLSFTAGTISMWVQTTGSDWGNTYARVFGTGDANNGLTIGANESNGTWFFQYRTVFVNLTPLAANEWHHIAVTWDALGSLVAYSDGLQVATGTKGSTPVMNASYIGDTANTYFKGYIAQFAAWRGIALSPSQIASLADPTGLPATATPPGGGGGVSDQLWQIATLESSGRPVGVQFSFTAGDILINVLLFVLVSTSLFGIFVTIRAGRKA